MSKHTISSQMKRWSALMYKQYSVWALSKLTLSISKRSLLIKKSARRTILQMMYEGSTVTTLVAILCPRENCTFSVLTTLSSKSPGRWCCRRNTLLSNQCGESSVIWRVLKCKNGFKRQVRLFCGIRSLTYWWFWSRCLKHCIWHLSLLRDPLTLPPNLTQLNKILFSPMSSEMKNIQFFPLQVNPGLFLI